MALERIETVDSIIIRPLLKQVGAKKVVTTSEDGEIVSRNSYDVYFSQDQDITGESELFQTVANHYWSTL